MRTGARGRADTQPVTDNGIARALSADKQQIITNNIALQILKVSSLISNDVINTDAHHQWRYTSEQNLSQHMKTSIVCRTHRKNGDYSIF